MVFAKVGVTTVMGELVLTLAIVIVDAISDFIGKGVQGFISSTFCRTKRKPSNGRKNHVNKATSSRLVVCNSKNNRQVNPGKTTKGGKAIKSMRKNPSRKSSKIN